MFFLPRFHPIVFCVAYIFISCVFFFYTNVALNLLCAIETLSERQMVQHINSLAICHSLLTNRMCCWLKKEEKCYENTSAIKLHFTFPQTTVSWLIASAWISENFLLMFPETLSSRMYWFDIVRQMWCAALLLTVRRLISAPRAANMLANEWDAGSAALCFTTLSYLSRHN